MTFSSCQFILPTASIDGDPIEQKLNDNFYISDYCLEDNYCLLEKNQNYVYEMKIENIDSICFIDKNEIYLHSNEKYYLISERDIVEIDRINYKMVSINNYLNN
ncbi:hypothetical protein M0M57_15900 [Flavobacterium azooxidireducens]|uniref:Uncharacterized protein n=1 Tax=Flavobacterium azooxidireducens TaxID=1871076 RepID=A0ABY4KI55_9FLAO|nr:hypothetical protein [Flavobacterium azooxidireducens]UPQ79090.1 hypothetical protein M0M57_15900 [Flavobacterium azooxidireducens]